jgi:voltage-gated potassium channel
MAVSESTQPRGALRRLATGADPMDLAMLALAVFSIGLLLWWMIVDPEGVRFRWVFIVDTSICGVFFIEFLFRWRSAGWQRSFPLARWYEIIGMIPLAHPALRSFRLLRIVAIVVRIVRAMDVAFGEQFTFRLVDRLSAPIVRAIKKPITLAVLDEVVKVLEVGHYSKNVARSLRENGDELRGLVLDKLKEDQTAGRFKRVPFHDTVVQSVIDTSLRVTLEVLADPRIDEFVAHAVSENVDQIRLAVERGLHQKGDEQQARAATDRSGAEGDGQAELNDPWLTSR